jgi:integrase
MSRQAKGARLWLEPTIYTPDGKVRRRTNWVIRDGTRFIRTGCLGDNRTEAERKLAEYIGSKYQVSRERSRHPGEILVLDVLNIYLADEASRHARPKETKQRVLTLADFWQPYTLAEVNGQRCRDYVAWRTKQKIKCFRSAQTSHAARLVSEAAARRELEDLRSAINHHRREGLCSEIVAVALPDKAGSRAIWLTRQKAARLIRAAWRARQVMRDKMTKRDVGRHIARFILVGLYTGTRHAAICGAAMRPAIGRGYVDLERGVFHRRPLGGHNTKKRQPPVRISDRLLAHVRRWERLGIATHGVVEWNGKPVRSVRKGFAAAVKAAGLPNSGPDKITPHVLRHTAATWAMQNGADMWATAGMLGMTVEMLQEVYGHHHPDFQRDAVNRIAGYGRLGDQNGHRTTVNKQR